MKRLSLLTISALMLTFLPVSASANQADPYADAVAQASPMLFFAQDAIGEPDGAYALFRDQEELRLDMGANEEGTGDLILHYKLGDIGAIYSIVFQDLEGNTLDSESAFFPNANEGSVKITYEGEGSYRYVKIVNPENEEFLIDSIEAVTFEGSAGITDPDSVPEGADEPPEEEIEPHLIFEESTPGRGLLVKLQDDGNPDTDYDTAVYVIGNDRMRHAFPTKAVYDSWYPNFDDVVEVSQKEISQYPIGKNVTVRPGTYLIKLQTDPKTYAVEPGGVLRHIASEEVALEVYGNNWAKRVIDMPDTFFPNYTVGDPLDTFLTPTGSVGVLPETLQLVYIENARYHSMEGHIVDAMRFARDEFVVQVSIDIAANLIESHSLGEDPTIKYPY